MAKDIDPSLPTDGIIDELARRVMHKALTKINAMLGEPVIKLETLQTYAMIVQAASEGMLPPEGSDDE
jgi:hypothetical protein